MDKERKGDQFTHEKLLKNFKSQFELVNYSIHLARNMIYTGRDPRVKTANQNKAVQILEEIVQGKDKLDDVYEPEKGPEHTYTRDTQTEERFGEKKKSRKIIANR